MGTATAAFFLVWLLCLWYIYYTPKNDTVHYVSVRAPGNPMSVNAIGENTCKGFNLYALSKLWHSFVICYGI